MTEPIESCTNTHPPSDSDEMLLTILLGEKTCIDSGFMKFLWHILLPLLITAWVLLVLVMYKKGMTLKITDNNKIGLAVLGVIFFIGVLILDYVITKWREDNPICSRVD